MCTVSAAAVAAGTFLPWRSVGGSSSDGWSTAHLVLSLANAFDDSRLRLVAFAFFLVPLCALGAWWFLLLVPSPLGALSARALSVSTLTAAIASTVAAASQPSVHVAPEGPVVSVAAASLLSISCWGLSFRGRRMTRSSGELS
jgi:hypothetical protein